MKTIKELDEYIQFYGIENSRYLSEEETVTAIVGHDDASGALIYDYWKLVEAFAQHFKNCDSNVGEDEKSEEEYLTEAEEWICFNTIRSLPYTDSAYIAYDKDGNEVGRFRTYKEDDKAKAEEAAGEGGHVDFVEYINPIIMHGLDDIWGE